MSKLYEANDLIKLFTKLEGKFEDLKCFVKECCAKIPVNIGTGIGIFKRFNANKWEFKSLLPGNNILITETAKEIIISSTTEPIDCNDIKDCIGVSVIGNPNKYLNEQGNWQTITIPNAPTLQEVVNTGNGISNFGGIGTASIQSTNFTNNRTLYLNDNNYPTIRLVDNNNSSNYLQIDVDTLNLDGNSYNWSSIVNPTIPTVGTWGTLNYPAWTTGTPFVKMTAAGTFSLDTNTYLTSAITSLGGLTGATQTFTNDTNVTIVSSGTDHAITWAGTLADSRIASASTWNAKQPQLNGTGFIKASGTTISYDNSTYLTAAVTSIATAGLISGGTITGTGTITTSITTNKLVGRSTAGTGVMEEVSVGTGLSLSGGTLSATASSSVGFEMNFLLMGA